MMNDIVMEFYEVLRERDRKAQAKEIALAAIKNGITNLEAIAKATGIPLSEVEALAKKENA